MGASGRRFKRPGTRICKSTFHEFLRIIVCTVLEHCGSRCWHTHLSCLAQQPSQRFQAAAKPALPASCSLPSDARPAGGCCRTAPVCSSQLNVNRNKQSAVSRCSWGETLSANDNSDYETCFDLQPNLCACGNEQCIPARSEISAREAPRAACPAWLSAAASSSRLFRRLKNLLR